MMYDSPTLKSFTERALDNYNQCNTENDITKTICCLAGILSILDDIARKDIFADFNIPEYIQPEPNYYIDETKDNNNSKIALIRHFRNSLCHFKLDGEHIKPDNKNEIKEIIFEDYYKEKINFSCTLTANEIQQFLIDIGKHIIEKTKDGHG